MADIAYGLHEISVTSTQTEFYLNNTDTRTMLIRGLGFCVLFLSLSLALQAQCDDSVDHYCHDSRIVCDPASIINEVFQMNDTTCFSQDTVIKCLGIWDINFDNPYWFRFTTTGTTLNLEFLIDNCMAGSSGIQYALLRDCDYDDTLECVASNGGAPFGIEGVINISETVDPGETYALVIDGFGGSVCEISFNDIQGVGTIFLDPISSIQQFDFPNDTICQGAQNILFDLDFPPGSNIDFADLFIWTLSHEGMELWDSITIDSNLLVDFDGLTGDYELCAFAFNACDTTNVVCSNFYLKELTDQVLDTFRFCISDLPLAPDDPNFMLPDLINSITPNPAVFPIVNGYGCVFNQIVPLDPLSDSKRFFLDTAFCGTGPVTLNGQEYSTDQNNVNIVLDGLAANGCDSLITLNLAFIDFDGSLSADNCAGNMIDIEFIESIAIPSNADTVIYHWTNDIGNTMTNVSNGGRILTVSERDTFHLEVFVDKFGTECIKNFDIYAEPSMGELSVSCDSIGLNGIRFLWNDIENADGYQVWINSVDQGITNDTTFLLSGLSPDEFVNIDVEVLTSGFCPGPMESKICQTSSCPTVDFVLSPLDTSYCITSNMANINFQADFNVNPFGSTGLWSGPFIDPNSGIFDTNLAGEGTFKIFYTFDQNGCSYIDSITVLAKLTPSIELMADTILCVDDQLNIQVDGTFNSMANYNWELGTAVLTGVKPGPFLASWPIAGNYEIKLQLDQSGCLSNRDSIQIKVEPEIVPPTLSCGGGNSLDSLYFEWNNTECVSSFRVVIDSEDKGIQTDTFYILNNLLPGQEVDFELTAISDCICDDETVQMLCSTDPCPVVPEPFILCDGGNSLDSLYFEWNQVWCTDSYQIFIDNVDMGIQGDTFYVLEGLLPDQLINFRVVALNECLCEDVDFEVNCSTAPCPIVPAPVIICDGGGSLDSLYFEWNQVWCTNSYQVFIDNVDMGTQSDTFYVLDGLLPDQLVNFRVIALNECLCNDVEFEMNCSTTACPMIPEPIILCDGGNSLDSLYFEWNQVWCTDTYQIFIDNVDMGIQGDTFYILEGLLPDQLVNFRVVGLNECLCEDIDFEVNCSTTACPMIPEPIILCDGGNSLDSLYFEWNQVWCTDTYQIFIDNVDMGIQGDTFYILEGLLPDQLVNFRVVGLNECLCEDIDFEVNCSTTACPIIPEPVIQCDGGGSLDSLYFEWNQVWCTDTYQIFIDNVDMGIQGDTFYILEGLLPDQLVNFRVVGLNECLCEDIDFEVNCSTTACPIIPEPVIQCDGGGTLDSLYFEWNQVWCTDNYQIFIDNEDMGIQSDTFFILEGLLPDQLVNFQVVALNECLCEDVVFEVNCSTMECPFIPPPNFLCQGSTDSLYFEWTSVSCATNFQIYIDDVDMGIQTDTFFILENLMPEQVVKFELVALNECLCPDVILIENCMTEACPIINPPLLSCEGTTTSINIEWPTVECTDNYQVFIDGMDKGIQSDTFFNIVDLIPEQEVDIRIVALNECACEDVEITEKCFARACPPITLQIGSINDLCEEELNGAMQFEVQVSGSNGTGFGYWLGEGIDSLGLFNPDLVGVGTHKIYYQFREVACTYIDSTEISIFQNPVATFTVDPPICPGDEAAIVDISASGGDGDYLFELGTSSRMDGYFDGVMVGTHPIVIVDGNGCIFDTSVVIEFPTIPEFNISGPDLTQENSRFTLELTGDVDWPEIDSIQWLKNGFVVPCEGSGCDFRFEDIAIEESVYCTVVFFRDRCNVTTCFPMAVKKNLNLFIPNVLNPTSPFFNNQFTVFSNDQLHHVNYIRVFDRWGEMMWQAEDFIPSENANISWDGYFNGEIVNPGVYIYMIEVVDIHGITEKYSGDLTIIR